MKLGHSFFQGCVSRAWPDEHAGAGDAYPRGEGLGRRGLRIEDRDQRKGARRVCLGGLFPPSRRLIQVCRRLFAGSAEHFLDCRSILTMIGIAFFVCTVPVRAEVVGWAISPSVVPFNGSDRETILCDMFNVLLKDIFVVDGSDEIGVELSIIQIFKMIGVNNNSENSMLSFRPKGQSLESWIESSRYLGVVNGGVLNGWLLVHREKYGGQLPSLVEPGVSAHEIIRFNSWSSPAILDNSVKFPSGYFALSVMLGDNVDIRCGQNSSLRVNADFFLCYRNSGLGFHNCCLSIVYTNLSYADADDANAQDNLDPVGASGIAACHIKVAAIWFIAFYVAWIIIASIAHRKRSEALYYTSIVCLIVAFWGTLAIMAIPVHAANTPSIPAKPGA
jgi:hypothetical protein